MESNLANRRTDRSTKAIRFDDNQEMAINVMSSANVMCVSSRHPNSSPSTVP